jgi:hypothetical protein
MDIFIETIPVALNILASASFSTAQGRGETSVVTGLRKPIRPKNKQPGNRYDWSRKHLNFEVMSGKKKLRGTARRFISHQGLSVWALNAKSLKRKDTSSG